jgi:hypothetical protein
VGQRLVLAHRQNATAEKERGRVWGLILVVFADPHALFWLVKKGSGVPRPRPVTCIRGDREFICVPDCGVPELPTSNFVTFAALVVYALVFAPYPMR